MTMNTDPMNDIWEQHALAPSTDEFCDRELEVIDCMLAGEPLPEALETHASTCPVCLAVLVDRPQPEEIPAAIETRLKEDVRTQLGSRRGGRWMWLVTAAAIVLMVVGAWQMSESELPPEPVPVVAEAFELEGTGTLGAIYHGTATADGGMALVGLYGDGQPQVFVQKIDADLNVVWTRDVSGTLAALGTRILETGDGGLVVAGQCSDGQDGNWDQWVVRLDAKGDLLWSRRFGGPGGEASSGLVEYSDGSLLVTGASYPIQVNTPRGVELISSYPGAGVSVLTMAKLDAGGALQRYRVLDPAGSQEPWTVQASYALTDLVTLDNDSVAIAATAVTTANRSDGWILRLDRNLDVTWQRTVDRSAVDQFAGITRLPSGALVAVGYTDDSEGTGDQWAVCVDADGEVLWERRYDCAATEFLVDVRWHGEALEMVGVARGTEFGSVVIRADESGEILSAQRLQRPESGLTALSTSFSIASGRTVRVGRHRDTTTSRAVVFLPDDAGANPGSTTSMEISTRAGTSRVGTVSPTLYDRIPSVNEVVDGADEEIELPWRE
jgi:hypothetical protein